MVHARFCWMLFRARSSPYRVTWVRGIKLRLFAFSSVAASHDSFATGLPSGRPIFVLPLLRDNKAPGCHCRTALKRQRESEKELQPVAGLTQTPPRNL